MRRLSTPALAALLAALLVALASSPALAQATPDTSPDRRDPGAVPKPEVNRPEQQEEEGRITFIPVPVLYSDPNIGYGVGLMPVILLQSEKRIDWIFAPSIDYNQIVGTAFTSRIFFYPTPQEELVVYNSISTGPNLEESAQFRGRDRFFYGTDLFARAYYIVDGTHRFYGVGSSTAKNDESDYELRELGCEGEFGYRFFDVLRLSGTSRYRQTEVRRGIIDKVPDTVDLYPSANGVGQGDIDVLALGGRICLDLRDEAAIPNDGLYADAYFEGSAKGLVSDTRYERWGASITHHLPIVRPGRFVHVTHARYAAIEGDDKFPFWELPTLGGGENLRGFGAGRFTGEQSIVVGVEERVRIHELVISDNPLAMEIAPFFEVGRVFGHNDPLNQHRWQAIPGIGGRLLLPDSSIVARLDIGIPLNALDEGPAVFITLGYPF